MSQCDRCGRKGGAGEGRGECRLTRTSSSENERSRPLSCNSSLTAPIEAAALFFCTLEHGHRARCFAASLVDGFLVLERCRRLEGAPVGKAGGMVAMCSEVEWGQLTDASRSKVDLSLFVD